MTEQLIKAYGIFYFKNSDGSNIYVSNTKTIDADLNTLANFSDSIDKAIEKIIKKINKPDCKIKSLLDKTRDYELIGYTLFDKRDLTSDEFSEIAIKIHGIYRDKKIHDRTDILIKDRLSTKAEIDELKALEP